MNVEQAFSYVRHSAEGGRLAQAYVVVAPPRGVGDELSLRVLELLYCADDDVPCGSCRGCQSVHDRTHPDVHWIEPQKKSRTIAIEQVRGIQKKIYETAFAGGWKACVIVGVDCMSTGAANAFLKTLEEPPAETLFLLLTDSPQRLLPTILSRCQRLNVSGMSGDGLDPEIRESVAAILADACADLDVQRLARADRLVALLKGVRKTIETDERDAIDEEHEEINSDTLDARISSRYRELRQTIMRSILFWYRDILLLSCGSDPALVQHGASVDYLQSVAANVSFREAMQQVRAVEEMNRQLAMNMPETLVFTNGFASLR
jgi:DNA polymerase-3 subunit delta'